MSIDQFLGGTGLVDSPESMHALIVKKGILPFFANVVEGWSLQENTARDSWFTEEQLGPWDWKIDCVQEGDIAYGKFLLGGKSSFASRRWYLELMNWRRSLGKYTPSGMAAEVLDLIRKEGSSDIRTLRRHFSVKKNAMDAVLAKLEMGTWIIIGDFQRVYSGPDLHYSGWQTAAYCTPEDFFDGGPASRPPMESRELLAGLLEENAPGISEKTISKILD